MLHSGRLARRHRVATVLLGLCLLGLWALDRSGGEQLAEDRLALAMAQLGRRAVRRLGAPFLDARGRPARRIPVRLDGEGPARCLAAVRRAAARSGVFHLAPPAASGLRLQVRCQVRRGAFGVTHLRMTIGLARPTGPPRSRASAAAVRGPLPDRVRLEQRISGFLALVPPLVAIVLALATGQILLSMAVALFAAALLLGLGRCEYSGSTLPDLLLHLLPELGRALPVAAWRFVVLPTLAEFKLQILAFAAALVGMVAVISRAGGTQGVVAVVSRMGGRRRLAQLSVWLMGLAIFFDDCANTLVVGSAARPLTDSARVSREKLAYLVDSTAAPVAGVALVSTWIGFEVGLFQTAAASLGLGQTGMGLFLHAWPYRFYCFLTLCFVLLTVLVGREFGPMLAAERLAHQGHGRTRAESPAPEPTSPRTYLSRTAAGLEATSPPDSALRPPPAGLPPRWHVAAAPIALVILAVPAGLVWLGHRSAGVRQALSEGLYATGSAAHLRDCLVQAARQGQQGWALLGAGLLGSALAFVLAFRQRRHLREPGPALGLRDLAATYGRGARAILGAMGVLVGAWGIQAACEALGTSTVLTAALSGVVAPHWLPGLIFVTAAGVAFATGTSWGTMGIVIPAVLPAAVAVAGPHRPEIIYLSAAAVLDGAIFGDHCSPLSDTTVMSSLSTGCPLIAHVRTQLPYAVTVMLVAAWLGYVGVAAGAWGAPLAYGLAFATLLAVLWLVGRPVATRPGGTPPGLQAQAPR